MYVKVEKAATMTMTKQLQDLETTFRRLKIRFLKVMSDIQPSCTLLMKINHLWVTTRPGPSPHCDWFWNFRPKTTAKILTIVATILSRT